jgi:hypothetical protein
MNIMNIVDNKTMNMAELLVKLNEALAEEFEIEISALVPDANIKGTWILTVWDL